MRVAALFCVAAVAGAVRGEDAPPPRPALTAATLGGVWAGRLPDKSGDHRVRFVVVAGPDGVMTATTTLFDFWPSPMLTKFAVAGRKVSFTVAPLKSTFTGTLGADDATLTGQWSDGEADVPVVLKKVVRPQTPTGPFPYDAVPVTFDNPAAKVTLAGTLTVPKGPGPFPAVVLVSGDAPHNRDGMLFNHDDHKPFWVLADYLTRRGVAVLRHDDRGVNESTGDRHPDTMFAFAGDTAAAVAFLAKRAGIDPKRIGVVGHGDGGVMAAMVAADRPGDVAFAVLLAAPGVTGGARLAAQVRDSAVAAGETGDALTVGVGLTEAWIKAVPPGVPQPEAKKKLLAAVKAYLATVKLTDGKVAPFNEATWEDDVARWSDPKLQHFIHFDPRPTYAKVKCPVLALNGDKDLEVRAADNLAGIKAANPATVVRSLPGLNHTFQRCKTGLDDEVAEIEQTLAPELLAAVGDWVTKAPARK